jgi:PPP family 3-phenylpropionic acid transporter
MLWALGVISEMLVFIWLPRVMLRYWAPLLIASVLLTSARWGMIASSDGRLWVLLSAQFLHAASFGVFHAVGIEWIRRMFSGGLAGRGQALYNAVGFGIGGSLGAAITGILWPVYGASVVYWLGALVSLLALLVCLPAILHAKRYGGIAGVGFSGS